MTLLLQQVTLGTGPWWVSAIVMILFITSAVINLVQFYKGREVARWKTAAEAADKTADIYKSELAIVRERAMRIEEERQKLNMENAELRGRTDLTKLEKQIADAGVATSGHHAAVLKSVVDLSSTIQSHSAHEERVLSEISTSMTTSARAMQDICRRLEALAPAA